MKPQRPKLIKRQPAVAAQPAAAAPAATPPALGSAVRAAIQQRTSAATQEADMATLAAQAISKVEQLTAMLQSPEFLDQLTQRLIQNLGTSGMLDELISESLTRKSQLVGDLVREQLRDYVDFNDGDTTPPEAIGSVDAATLTVDDGQAQPPEADDLPLTEHAGDLPPSAEEVRTTMRFILVQPGETPEPGTTLVIQPVMPIDMNPANMRVNFFTADDHGHLTGVLVQPGFEDLALELIRSNPNSFAYNVNYLVKLVSISRTNPNAS